MDFTKKNRIPFGLFLGAVVIVYVVVFGFSFYQTLGQPNGLLINDVSRLNPTYVKKIVKNEELFGLQETLTEARNNNLKVSIAGKRHSMGGHAFYDGAVVLDMSSFNKIININQKEKLITIQSGATWDDVIEAVNPYNLSVPVLQDYSGFSVGGSMSVNVHQSDPNYGPLSETVQSFRLLLADGTVRNVSRVENPELFSLVIGGYGLFGVILDATIELTENDIYKKNELAVDYGDYMDIFNEIRANKNIENVFARLSIVNDSTLLKDVVVTTYEKADILPTKTLTDLAPDKNLTLKKVVFGLSRKYGWGKRVRWYLQKEKSDMVEPLVISRNNLDKNDQSFLEYYSSRDTDILQEYFFSMESLPEFLDILREIIREKDINLLSATIRYVPKNEDSFLSYSRIDSFAVVLYFNVGLSEKEQDKVEKWTQELIAHAVRLNGTYYLPYELYASQKQIRQAYPNLDVFFAKKMEYDPQELFVNKFYEKYAHGKEAR